MHCQNHPDIEAKARCAGCAETFCGNCLVDMAGQAYCGACKSLALGGRTPRLPNAATASTEAGSALMMACISYVIFGVILGPAAMHAALSARRQIAADPNMLGWGKATAALWLGLGGLVLTLLSYAGRATH